MGYGCAIGMGLRAQRSGGLGGIYSFSVRDISCLLNGGGRRSGAVVHRKASFGLL